MTDRARRSLRRDAQVPRTHICAGLTRSVGRRIVHALLITLLVGFFVVRYAIRQYFRKELTWGTDNQLH